LFTIAAPISANMPQIDSFEVPPIGSLNRTPDTSSTKNTVRNPTPEIEIAKKPVNSESSPADKESEKDVVEEIKYLYEGEQKCSCCINWTSTKPEIKKEENGSVMTVRQSRDHNNEKPLAIHSILIHSSQLKDTLLQVLKGYANVLEDDPDHVL
jgi:hypothetical protein